MKNFNIRRVDILFVVGLVIVLSEALRWRGPPNPTLIFAGLALMGLPVISRADEKIRKNGNGKNT